MLVIAHRSLDILLIYVKHFTDLTTYSVRTSLARNLLLKDCELVRDNFYIFILPSLLRPFMSLISVGPLRLDMIARFVFL